MPVTIKGTPVNAPIRKRGYSPKEAAAATGLSLATINRGIADGSIPSTKYKDRRIISDATIDALVSPAESAA
jgi:excisionase family DNA binding protein